MLYPRMETLGEHMQRGLQQIFASAGITACVTRQGSAFSYYFMSDEPRDLHDIVEQHDFRKDLELRRALIARGVFFIPIATKQCSLCAAHTQADVDFTLAKFEEALSSLSC
jgi:glutamate-1-semialdehyde 2,1-aminomutase